MNPQEEFSNLTTKFLFLNCDSGRNENVKAELNILLNELSSLDYSKQKHAEPMTAARLLESFTKIPSNEDTLIVKSCCLISMIVNKQKIQLQENNFRRLIEWLLKTLNFSFYSAGNDILSAMQALFKNHPQFCEKYLEDLLSPDGLLLKLLDKDLPNKRSAKENYDAISPAEMSLYSMLCIESLLNSLEKFDETDKYDNLLVIVGKKVIDILYQNNLKFENDNQKVAFYASALSSLHTILNTCRDWFEQNVGEVLGICNAFIFYGLPDFQYVHPQKVLISQQTLFDNVSVAESKGGKVAKTRKPRTISKNKKNAKAKNTKPSESNQEERNTLKVEFDNVFLSPFSRTSDSDFSESETGRSQSERHKKAKVRLASISLIGLMAKIIDKKLMYGYWHSMFPSDANSAHKGILWCVLKDPNPRCRVAASQAASLLFFGSKPFLIQAENSERTPSTFMPFSTALGNMIVSAYETLTQALSMESSLPVLTQILKCLSVLIQATPFHRLQKGFVTNFVKYVRRLVYHRDPTIQVASLMVMGLLISVQEITSEISDCVGLPENRHLKKKNQNQLNDAGIHEFIESQQEEEYLDSDYEEIDVNEDGVLEQSTNEVPAQRISWLLQRVIENLGIPMSELKKATIATTAPVRIESLQVLSAMSPHFALIEHHLPLVSSALKMCLEDPLPEIRLYSAKTLDVIGHSINTFLLEKGSGIPEKLESCRNFWTSILPFVIQKIQDTKQNSTFKATLCDFLSNIGVHVFERLPRNGQIQIISLLSGVGCVEENTTRAAAVRALAVYALFPSLREDLCFIENTAESILNLMKDQNLYVRIKASWSMGNVTDALVTNSMDSHFDRISNDLLRRMLEIAIDAAGENDKVRCNAVRTIGNLLRLMTEELLKSDNWTCITAKAIKKLIFNVTSGGSAKVKWNSCYAIGNFMQNSALFTKNCKEFTWQEEVFSALCDLIINSVNFKVRINGSIALTSLKQRANYGSHFQIIWSSLLSALEQSNNLVDFNEYKHRDNLQEQLCLSLAHIIKISTPEDYVSLKNELIPRLETTKQIWIRVLNRVLPENTAPLVESSSHLKSLVTNEILSLEQKNSIQVLASCFVPPQEYI